MAESRTSGLGTDRSLPRFVALDPDSNEVPTDYERRELDHVLHALEIAWGNDSDHPERIQEALAQAQIAAGELQGRLTRLIQRLREEFRGDGDGLMPGKDVT